MHKYVGVDVSRDSLEVALAPEAATRRFPNTVDGAKHLSAWLRWTEPKAIWHVILEPTSTYHQVLVQTLSRQRLSWSVVNPAQSARYARMHGSRVKTDPADARMLARYGERETPAPSPEPDEDQERLRSLRRHSEWLEGEIRSASNRLEAAGHSPWTPASVRHSLERVLRDLKKELARVERELQALVHQKPRWAQGVEVLTTIPGVGVHTAVLILSELPPIARSTNGKQWVAFCGIDPHIHQSGTSKWSTLSRVGSNRTRAGLYLPSASAMRWNPPIRALNERLKAGGKSGRVRVFAAMNKLLHQCFAILRSGKPFDPALYQQGRLDFQYGI